MSTVISFRQRCDEAVRSIRTCFGRKDEEGPLAWPGSAIATEALRLVALSRVHWRAAALQISSYGHCFGSGSPCHWSLPLRSVACASCSIPGNPDYSARLWTNELCARSVVSMTRRLVDLKDEVASLFGRRDYWLSLKPVQDTTCGSVLWSMCARREGPQCTYSELDWSSWLRGRK